MLNVSVRPQVTAVAAVSALAATAGEMSPDQFLVERIAAGSRPAMQALFARHRTYVRDDKGRESMRVFVRDVVLFCCLLVFLTGIVIAVASLLS